MGYTTEFEGVLFFKEPVTSAELLKLSEFLGEHTDDIDSLIKPEGYRGYIQFELADTVGIKWDGGEKFYDSVEACNTIIMTMQKDFPDFALGGELMAQGEEFGDVWKLAIVDGVAKRIDLKIDGHVKCPECEHIFPVTGNEYDN